MLADDNDDDEHALSVSHHAAQENTMETVCNLITDLSMDAVAVDQPTASTCTSALLKDLQPHKEKPSKDRRRRFYCPALYGDQAIPSNHDVFLFDFWAIHPTKRLFCDLKNFLIGKVMLLMECESSCDSGSLSNPNLTTILEIYEHNVVSNAYNSAGRTGLLKVHKT